MTQDEAPQSPAKVTSLHKQDRELSTVAGAPKGYRRIDRLQWLKDHGTIADHQFFAGRRLQDDWQLSKIENCPGMGTGTRGGGVAQSTLSDAKLDALERVSEAKKALSILPHPIVSLVCLFLLPEDEPFSLERCASMVKIHRQAASLGIQTGLSLLARHYGFASD